MPAKPLFELTAADLMATDVIRLADDTPLRDAAALMLKHQIGGAPVVDTEGRCVGVLSAIDFLRVALTRAQVAGSLAPPLPVTCAFQTKRRLPDGEEVVVCTLPPGVCPIQVKRTGPRGEAMIVCGQPHCVMADWQVVDTEKLPTEPVRLFMTADPVTMPASTPIRILARAMIDAHIHRIVVVDTVGQPAGVVSSTDVLAALAYAEDGK